MEWWNDIWLNEGFARFAEHHILHELRPEFRCWDKYLKDVYEVAMNCDNTASKTHPVQLEVPSADQLMNIFDTISYAKGSVICRMMADFTGSKFKQILQAYMKKFQFKNATTADLIGICDEICGLETIIKPSEYLMPWITQKCFPRVTITRTGEHTYNLI